MWRSKIMQLDVLLYSFSVMLSCWQTLSMQCQNRDRPVGPWPILCHVIRTFLGVKSTIIIIKLIVVVAQFVIWSARAFSLTRHVVWNSITIHNSCLNRIVSFTSHRRLCKVINVIINYMNNVMKSATDLSCTLRLQSATCIRRMATARQDKIRERIVGLQTNGQLTTTTWQYKQE